MLQTHLEGVRTDGAITGVTLVAEPTRPVQRQFGLFEAVLKDPHQFQETLARLSALVGVDRVGSPVREDSHRPDAFRLVPPDFENAPMRVGRGSDLGRRTPWRRFRPPVPATVSIAPTPAAAIPGSPAAAAKRLDPAEVAAWLDPLFRPGAGEISTDKVVPFPGASPESGPQPSAGRFEPGPAPRTAGAHPGSVGSLAMREAGRVGKPALPAQSRQLRGGGFSHPPSHDAQMRPTAARPEPGPGRPVSVRSPVGGGLTGTVSGPWESSGRWWESDAWSRAEWDVVLRDGVGLRLVETGGGWMVEGVID